MELKKKYLIKYLKKKLNKFLDGFFVQLEFSRSADRIWGFSTFDLHNVMEDDIFVCNLPSICAPDFYGARNDGMALLKDTHLQWYQRFTWYFQMILVIFFQGIDA